MARINSQIQIGQTVSLKDEEFGYQLVVLPGEQSGHKVIEVGADFVLLDDEAAGVQTRLPAHLIKGITVQPTGVPQAA